MGPSKEEQEALDRRVKELIGEIRVILPSVTVLFAFLITLPFRSHFSQLSTNLQTAFFVAFLCSALAMVFLIGQSAYHRVRGKPYDKAMMLRTANRQAVAAVVLLAVAMASVVFLVVGVVYKGKVAAFFAAGLLVVALITWIALPLKRRLDNDHHGSKS